VTPPEYEYGFKQCPHCRETNRASQAQARKFESEDGNQTVSFYLYSCNLEVTDEHQTLTSYENSQKLFTALRRKCQGNHTLEFDGTFMMAEDPLVTDKERVQMFAHEVWKKLILGWQSTRPLEDDNGIYCKTCFWCCQDAKQKQKSCPSQREGAKHCDTLGMEWFNCQSRLILSCKKGSSADECIIIVHLHHYTKHKAYYDVAMPPEVTEIIKENLEWCTPNSLVLKVQALYPSVTANQVHTAWTTMSEIVWK
ncbi:hypothetical protein BU17DRAFT_45849, partial [Hysterangium stoloniferum]